MSKVVSVHDGTLLLATDCIQRRTCPFKEKSLGERKEAIRHRQQR